MLPHLPFVAVHLKIIFLGGPWVAQSVKPLTLAQVMISQFVGSSPVSGSVLTTGAWSLLQLLCLPLSLCPPLVTLCLSLKNK